MWPFLLDKFWQFLVHELKQEGYFLWLESWLICVVVDLGSQTWMPWSSYTKIGWKMQKKKDVGELFTFEGDVLEVHEEKLDQSSYFKDNLLQYIPYRHGFDFNLSLQFAFWILTSHFASILCSVQISHVKLYNILDFKLFRFQIWFQFSIIYICLCMVQCAIGANACFLLVYVGSMWNIVCLCWFIVEHCLSLLVPSGAFNLRFRFFPIVLKIYHDQSWYPLLSTFKK